MTHTELHLGLVAHFSGSSAGSRVFVPACSYVTASTETDTETTTTDCLSPPSSLVTLPVFKQTQSKGRMDF